MLYPIFIELTKDIGTIFVLENKDILLNVLLQVLSGVALNYLKWI